MPADNTRLAVLIDADNISSKHVQEMFNELARYGTLTVKRAYGDWANQSLNGWRDVLLTHAILPKQQFAYTKGKNASDAALIIDAMDLLHSGNVDGFAIVSSDSDFTPLAMRLRESGKSVIGVGQRKTPAPFVEACERFLFVEVLAEDSATEPAKDDAPKSLHSLLTRALNQAQTDDDNWCMLTTLGSHLNRIDPSFDTRTYKFSKLSDLVRAQAFVETRTTTEANGHERLWVRLKGRRNTPAATPVKAVAKKMATKKASAAKKPAAAKTPAKAGNA